MKKKATITEKNVLTKKILGVREKALIRARTARDKALRSIRNLNMLARDSCLNVDKRPLFKTRVNSMEKFVDEFEQCQQNILTALVNLDRTDEFGTVDALVSDEMEELTGNIQMVSDNQQVKSTTTNTPIKIPQSFQTLSKKDLPKFDGNIVEWRSFRDTFQSLVHEQSFISNIERFHYLISCLSGAPLAIVEAIPLSADNYNIAWSSLNKYFENHRLLATGHVDKLFTFPTIKKESAASLSAFVDAFRKHVSVIKTLDIKDLADFLLFHIGTRVLDEKTRRLFENSLSMSEIPNLDMLLNFVAGRSEFLEHVNSNSNSNEKSEPLKENAVKEVKDDLSAKPFVVATKSKNSLKCPFCNYYHQLSFCFSFKKKSVVVKRQFATINRLCFRCLKSGHSIDSCYSKFTCKKCQSNHNTILHLETKQSTSIEVNSSPDKQPTTECSINVTDVAPNFVSTKLTEMTVVIGTVIIRVQGMNEGLQRVRVLLDSTSHVSAVTEECVNRLNLRCHQKEMETVELSQQPVTIDKRTKRCSFFSLYSNELQFNVSNLGVLPTITKLTPGNRLPASVRDCYNHLVLGDPEFHIPGPVDMLLGSDFYSLLLKDESAEIIHSPGLPSAINTKLGWIIIGLVKEESSSIKVSLSSVTSVPVVESMLQ